MEQNLRGHMTYNSFLIITKLLIIVITFFYVYRLVAYTFLGVTIIYICFWAIISINSKKNFTKYFKSMRKLMMVFILFEAPNFFKIDLFPKETVKKEKYSYDTLWLYSYIKSRDFNILDKELLKTQVVKEIKQLQYNIKKTNFLVLGTLIASTLIFLFLRSEFPSNEYIQMGYLFVGMMNILVLAHNMFMKLLVRKNHNVIFKAFETEEYDKALRYSIIYLGLTKNKIYKTYKISYLKTFESNYKY